MSGGQCFVCVPLIAHHRIITGKLAVELLAFNSMTSCPNLYSNHCVLQVVVVTIIQSNSYSQCPQRPKFQIYNNTTKCITFGRTSFKTEKL